ncbi:MULTISPECIES: hypothetical protein [unclassified Streptomyces]|uniref:hypothetical protein n=1 Tax=unclassified Streptomyces TaxID=2593676 RepID=UPI002E31582B|nr:hypothetical protein [Streptomyces sp. NBC_01268]
MPAPSAARPAAPADTPSRAARTPAPRGHRRAPEEGPGGPGPDAASDVMRWAVFCCALVPVVLVVYGTSLGGAAGTALGLAAVTAACRVLLRRSENGLRAEHVRPRTDSGHPRS